MAAETVHISVPEEPLITPSSPIDAVVTVFGVILGIAVVRTLPQLVAFYAWFKDSGLKMAEHRGYGQSACKFYGLIPAPKLSVSAMALSGVSFLALILAPLAGLHLRGDNAPLVPGLAAAWRAPCFALALVCYHLYFSQVYCEAHVGAHVTVLIPPALILLALCPALDEVPAAAEQTAAFTCWLMKIVITSAYCGAGVCKISHSIASLRRGGSSWCTGSTLQASLIDNAAAPSPRHTWRSYDTPAWTKRPAALVRASSPTDRLALLAVAAQAFIFEAMLLSSPTTHSSFGVPTPFSHKLQRLHVLNPRALLLPASFAAVGFETLAPLLLLAPAHLASVPFALSGLAFHYGIALLQVAAYLPLITSLALLPSSPH